MKRPCYPFRPNLQNAEHRRAWAILQAVPQGERSAYLVQAILKSADEQRLLDTIRAALREELQNAPSTPQAGTKTQEPPAKAVPEQMLDFLGGFLED